MNRALCLALLLTGCSFHREMHWDKFPGAFVNGHCQEYATAVYNSLRYQHVRAYYTEFEMEWEVDGKKRIGAHAVVIFQKAGAWFIVDNEHAVPQPVKEGTRLEMVNQLYSATRVRDIAAPGDIEP